MFLRVLGPLEVDGATGPVSVGGPVPRRVLSALLARPGSVVAVDSLLEAAWGDAPPASAERTLQSHLTRLRETLTGIDPSVVVEHLNRGYRLVVDPGDVDAVRFVRLVTQAEDSSPVDAVPLLREALALWRPPVPYTDLLDTAYPSAEAARLEELHGAAVEALSGALLESGDAVAASAEAEARLRAAPYRERLWELLVVALYRQGRQADALAAYRRARVALDEGLGIEPGPTLRDLEARVLAQDPGLLAAPRAVRAPCPYKGLARYDANDAELFVGRERLIDELLARLVDGGLLVVVGPSGAGKSSIVRAGLVPALAAGALPGAATWQSTVVVPGVDPVGVLADAMSHHPHMLVVDQAEEALLADDGAHVTAFGDAVLAAVGTGTRVVLALRADFYGRLTEHPELARRAGPATVLIAPPDDDELRRIVVEPAARVGLRVEPALVDRVVADVRGRPGALPVLSIALVRTWEHREDGTLTEASYRAGGGVEAALQRVGEEAWAALEGDAQRAACRRLLLRLATDEDGQWVRRRSRRSEVVAAGDADAVAALAVLTGRRLVVARAEDVEIAHEALLTGWPRLRGWLEDSRSRSDVLDRLAVASAAWTGSGQDPTELYRGTRLQAALDTASASPDDLTATERAFLAASRAESERELTEQHERAEREARGRRRVRAVAVGLALALVLAGIAGGYAVHQQHAAQDAAAAARSAATQADAARLGALARAGGSYDLSLLLAAQAVALDPSPQTKSDLFATLLRGDAVRSVRKTGGVIASTLVSPDGRSVLTLGVLGDLRTWPLSGGPPTYRVSVDHSSTLWNFGRSMAWLPHGQLLAGAQSGSTAATQRPSIVDPRTGDLGALAAGGANAFAVSPDGSDVTALGLLQGGAFSDKVVTGAVGAAPSRVHTVSIGAQGVSLTACGQFACILTSSNVLIRVRFTDGAQVSRAPMPPQTLSLPIQQAVVAEDIVSSRDGSLVAAANGDNLIRLVNPATGRVVRILGGTTKDARVLAFSADGRTVAGRDGDTVLVWHLDGAPLPDRYTGHGGRVDTAAFTPDGATLVTTGQDQAMIVWDLSGRARVGRVLTRTLAAQTDSLWAAGTEIAVAQRGGTLLFVDPTTGVLSRPSNGNPSAGAPGFQTARSGIGSDRLITADANGVTAIWALTEHRLVTVVRGLPPSDKVHAPDTWVSRDGAWAATMRDDSGIRVIDMHSGQIMRTLAPLPATKNPVYLVQVQGWTTDGTGIIIDRQWGGGPDSQAEVLVVDATTGTVRMRRTLPWTPEEAVEDVSGRAIAVGGDAGQIVFLDPTTGRDVAPPVTANDLAVYNLATSPDGRWFSASGGPPQVTLWDAHSFTNVGGPLPVDADTRDARARFTADSMLVVATGGTLRIFPTNPADWLARACREAGRTLTQDEWNTYLPGRPYDPACTTTGTT